MVHASSPGGWWRKYQTSCRPRRSTLSLQEAGVDACASVYSYTRTRIGILIRRALRGINSRARVRPQVRIMQEAGIDVVRLTAPGIEAECLAPVHAPL
jgi:hypothetical protein